MAIIEGRRRPGGGVAPEPEEKTKGQQKRKGRSAVGQGSGKCRRDKSLLPRRPLWGGRVRGDRESSREGPGKLGGGEDSF